jgi:hypothetical protein
VLPVPPAPAAGADGFFHYSTMLDRVPLPPFVPCRSRRSQRRSLRRSPMPSTGSSGSETDSCYSSPGYYDSVDCHRHHRSSSGHNPLTSAPRIFFRARPSGLSSHSFRVRSTIPGASMGPVPMCPNRSSSPIRRRKQRRGRPRGHSSRLGFPCPSPNPHHCHPQRALR